MSAIDDILNKPKGNEFAADKAGNYPSNAPAATQPAPVTTQPAPAATQQLSRGATPGETGVNELKQIQQKKIEPREPAKERTYANIPLTPPGLTEEEKKQKKREETWAAISDTISALSNLYFTTQYAPNAYDHRNNARDRVTTRWDKYLKDKRDAWNDQLKAREFDWKADAADRAQKAADDAHALATAQLEGLTADNNRKAELAPHKLAEAQAKAATATTQAQYAPLQQQRGIELTEGRIKTEQSKQYHNYTGGGSGGGQYEFRSKLYDKEKDWSADIYKAAEEYGIPVKEEVVIGHEGDKVKTKTQDVAPEKLKAQVKKYDEQGYYKKLDGKPYMNAKSYRNALIMKIANSPQLKVEMMQKDGKGGYEVKPVEELEKLVGRAEAKGKTGSGNKPTQPPIEGW